jgi:hypothetical protein
MIETRPTDADRDSLKAAMWCIALLGALGSLAGALIVGPRVLPSIAFGTLLALGNLWLIALIVSAFIAGTGPRLRWGVLTVLKFSGLLGSAYLLLRLGWVDLLPLAMGYAALPLGIVAAQLRRAEPFVQRD